MVLTPFIDAAFAAKLEDLKNDKSYTVIFYSSAVEPVYEADFADPAHLELRRNVESPVLRREKKTSGRDNRNLFEKYQFFTPGQSYSAPFSSVMSLANNTNRYLHGSHCCYFPFRHPVRWRQCSW